MFHSQPQFKRLFLKKGLVCRVVWTNNKNNTVNTKPTSTFNKTDCFLFWSKLKEMIWSVTAPSQSFAKYFSWVLNKVQGIKIRLFKRKNTTQHKLWSLPLQWDSSGTSPAHDHPSWNLLGHDECGLLMSLKALPYLIMAATFSFHHRLRPIGICTIFE